MKRCISILLLLFNILPSVFAIDKHYLKNETYTYEELIEVYKDFDKQSQYAKLIEIGESDNGKPIHLFVIDKTSQFSPLKAKNSEKTIILINNGIHAGEACGIDASVELTRNLLNTNSGQHKNLDSVVVLIVPVYNIGGILNRGKYSRANQNGPKEHGFRGNAKNLDLNRDFIKCDSKNAKTFSTLFTAWNPDIFIDTHTSNGSDHQYTMTLIATQKDKLNPVLSKFMQEQMLPELYQEMERKEMQMTPYVYSLHKTPKKGIKDFLETPRYSSGYASLFDCFSFITEAHVFKNFSDRVIQTLGFLETLVAFSANHRTEIKLIRKEAIESTLHQTSFPIEWELDISQYKTIEFRGYETEQRISEVTGNEMLFYNQQKEFVEPIQYFNTYKAINSVNIPKYYLIPQAYTAVIERLKLNGVKLDQLKIDSSIEVSVTYIKDYETVTHPYEAHYLHSNINSENKKEVIQFYQGDFIVSTNQIAVRYLVEVLEAESVDGFFAWNLFDGILQQKEWFSDYAFEPIAQSILEENKELNADFENKKLTDSTFASNNLAQLYYIYKRSPYYEPTANRFPIYRID